MLNIIGSGIRIAISTSKIKKIMVTMKNRIEKGIRAFFDGSNPHSNGVNFSRSFIDLLVNVSANISKRVEIREKINDIIVKIKNF